MCVMCSTSVPTLFQYFFSDHISTFLYIFHEMFFITCNNSMCCTCIIVCVRKQLLLVLQAKPLACLADGYEAIFPDRLKLIGRLPKLRQLKEDDLFQLC